jgi:predicted alpha/beta superfamily hydrolase
VAGTFNNWNPADPDHRLIALGRNGYTIMLSDEVRGPIEFKFTRGSWEAVETDADGGDVPNRVFAVPPTGPAVYTGTVHAWRDPLLPREQAWSTATASVSILSQQFEMPELERTRRVWIYLPPDYAASTKHYPVLYMQDGQNVFDAATSFAGEWGVDESLDSLHFHGDWGVIVVAVDNGGLQRFDEYSPWWHPRGGGEGKAYVDFIANTLKPWIDQHHRTRPGPEDTGIAGSSMGGVISLYAALRYPDVFGHAGVFSPALWATPELFDLARSFGSGRPRPRLYFVSGELEGATRGASVRDQDRMVEALKSAGFLPESELVALARANGTHSEGFWRQEFPAAYTWMFAGAPPSR